MSKTIYALAAIAVGGKHHEPGDVIRKGSNEERATLVRIGRASFERPDVQAVEADDDDEGGESGEGEGGEA